jgi:hypothetical protein
MLIWVSSKFTGSSVEAVEASFRNLRICSRSVAWAIAQSRYSVVGVALWREFFFKKAA